jgi:hypothetical protein
LSPPLTSQAGTDDVPARGNEPRHEPVLAPDLLPARCAHVDVVTLSRRGDEPRTNRSMTTYRRTATSHDMSWFWSRLCCRRDTPTWAPDVVTLSRMHSEHGSCVRIRGEADAVLSENRTSLRK